jgi:hypothetical protein
LGAGYSRESATETTNLCLSSFQGLFPRLEGGNPFFQAIGFDFIEALLETAQSFRDHHVFLFDPSGSTFQLFDLDFGGLASGKLSRE